MTHHCEAVPIIIYSDVEDGTNDVEASLSSKEKDPIDISSDDE